MPRTSRSVRDGAYYHVLNRGNGRQTIFHKAADYAAFVRVLAEGLERYPVDLLAWCLMPNHWHLVLSPRKAEALGRYMGWVGVTHVRRHHEHYHTRGGGHLYQGRFKSFPVQDNLHFQTVCRYVEANPKRAGLTDRAEDWLWSSLHPSPPPAAMKAMRKTTPDETDPTWPRLGAWPVSRPADWLALVNRAIPQSEQERLRLSIARGRPFGDEKWVAETVEEQGLIHTVRERGRPRKAEENQ